VKTAQAAQAIVNKGYLGLRSDGIHTRFSSLRALKRTLHLHVSFQLIEEPNGAKLELVARNSSTFYQYIEVNHPGSFSDFKDFAIQVIKAGFAVKLLGGGKLTSGSWRERSDTVTLIRCKPLRF
jgi:hypothetical protein